MKKLLLLLLIGTITFGAAHAQLSGTYTIGGTSPDYSTFADAQAALEAQGVSGPVIFIVRAGTYEEQIGGTNGYGAITGASETNTITFTPEAGDVIVGSGVQYGVYLEGGNYFIFDGLEITGSTSDGFRIYNDSDNNVVKNCKLHGCDGHFLNVRYSDNNTFYNNFLYNNLTDNRYGIYNSRSNNNEYYYNSIYGEFMYSAVYFYYSSPDGIDNIFINNIAFNNDADGSYMAAIRVNNTAAVAMPISDYNDLYAPYGNIGRISTTNYATLADWQTASGQDANSISADPVFVSNNINLHIYTSANIVDGMATPIAGIITDIDGDIRDASFPDIGADEYTYESGLPEQPTNPDPFDGAINVVYNTDLSWNGIADTFFVYLWDDAKEMIVDGKPTTYTTYDIPDLAYVTLYHWRIDAKNDAGTTTGIEWSFITGEPLSGIKTIGGTSPDFETIEAAINSLNANGVGPGGVTFLIRDGTYNENDNLIILDVAATAENPVVFRPDAGATVEIIITIIGDFNYAFKIHNSDYISFNGNPYGSDADSRNMTINGIRNNDDDVFVFWIANGSDHTTLENLIINSVSEATNTGWSTPVYCSTYGVTSPVVGMDSFTLSNCEVIGGSTYGVYMDGDPGRELSNFNIINNDVHDFQKYGVFIFTDIVGCNVGGNEVYQTFEASRTSVYGIRAGSSSCGGTTKIHHNYIHDLKHSELSGTRGIFMTSNSHDNLVYDNIIYLVPGLTANSSYCIYLSSGDATNNQIYYNTLYMGGICNREYPDFYCIRIHKDASDNILKNNILINERTGDVGGNEHCAIYLKTAASFAESDFNFLTVNSDNSSDNRYVARVGSDYYNTLSDLQNMPGYAPRDQNSLTGNPDLSFPDLHLNSTSICIGEATPIVGITTDFDYDLRSVSTPDIGADEYYDIPSQYILQLTQGWSGLSTWFQPEETSVETMFAPVVNALVILSNLSSVYWPGQINTLQDWDYMEGYQIKMTEDVQLLLNGTPLENHTINLVQGWNLIPVLSEDNVNVAELFSGVDLIIVKDVAGWGTYWPFYNINTLLNLETGKSYFVYMNSPGSITFPSGGDNINIEKPVEFVNISPWNDVYHTPGTHIVALTKEAIAAFATGDIIGAFTESGLCAGMVAFSENGTGLILNGDDIYTASADGFVSDEIISYRLYRPSTGETFDLEVEYEHNLDNSGLFHFNSMSAITSITLQGFETLEGLDDRYIRIYPNPSPGIFNIEGINQESEIQIFNAFGVHVFYDKLNSPVKIDLSGNPNGIYIIKISNDKEVYFEKVVLN